MHVVENNTFKFQFEHEIGEIGSTENVRLVTVDVFKKTGKGEEWIAHTHLEPHEAWELANFMTHGVLGTLADYECNTQVWCGIHAVWARCNDTHGNLCPHCEYLEARGEQDG